MLNNVIDPSGKIKHSPSPKHGWWKDNYEEIFESVIYYKISRMNFNQNTSKMDMKDFEF